MLNSNNRLEKTTAPRKYICVHLKRSASKFEKLIRQEEELKIASNLNVLVKNSLKVQQVRKEMLKTLRKSLLKC